MSKDRKTRRPGKYDKSKTPKVRHIQGAAGQLVTQALMLQRPLPVKFRQNAR
jgi:hypothetical protein